jgi:hypothetical protein
MVNDPTSSKPGLLWVTASIKRKDLPVSVLHAWYDEHMNDILTCPGNGGLFLRYKNLNPAADTYVDPQYAERASPGDTTWPFLGLVKLADVQWLGAKEFAALPLTSKLLPPEADGSEGNAFSSWFGAPRSYDLVTRMPDPRGGTSRPKYVLTVQMDKTPSDDSWVDVDRQIMRRTGFRGSVKYQLSEKSLLVFQEPGELAAGLAVYEFDGEEPPQSDVEMDGHVAKVDAWELICEAGDPALRL